MQNNDIVLDFICTDNQLADIFIKSLNEDRFCMIRGELGVYDPF